MDKAGRIVIPAVLRERQGIVPGPVEIEVDGMGLHITPIADDTLHQREGRVLFTSGHPLSVAEIRELRLGDQR